MKYKARIHTSLKKSVLDPQGQTTLHALAALVLADLGLPTLLEVAHGLFCWVIKFCGFLKPQFH